MTAPTYAFETTDVQGQLVDALRDGQSRIIGFGGGIRGTKTWGSLAALITLCRIYPGSRWAVIRKDLQRIRDTVIPSFEKLRPLAGRFVEPINYSTFNARCRNGSEILFRGENIDRDPELERFHGYEVNGFLNEEADELSERTFIKELERAGTWIIPNVKSQPPAYILNTFNPCSTWPRKRFYQPWRDNTIKPPYRFIPTTAADNPYISEAQRDAWKEMPENEYRRFVIGDWEAITGAYYDTLDAAVHLVDPFEVPDHWHRWASFDWGYRHWSVLCLWATNPEGQDFLLDSIWLRRMQDYELAETYQREVDPRHLREVYAGHDVRNKVLAHSASGESTLEVFSRYGIYLIPCDPDLINSGRAVNRALQVRVDDRGNRTSETYLMRTTGNLRVFDQLSQIQPDPNDVRKPDKVTGRFDADDEGNGGDDGADAFRHGVANRARAGTVPVADRRDVPAGVSAGYDYVTHRPREKLSGDEYLQQMFGEDIYFPRATKYRIPRKP